MSKVIRKFRQQKQKARLGKEYIQPSYPSTSCTVEAKVIDLFHERGRGAPLATIDANGAKYTVVATEGVDVGSTIQIGDNTEIKTGNFTKLKNIPEGSVVNSLEYEYNDGGKVALTGGAFCQIVNHRKESNITVIKLPS